MSDSPDQTTRTSAHLDADHEWRRSRAPEQDRLRRTLALLPLAQGSLLDVGIGEGDWLRLLAAERPALRLAAMDLSPRRLADLSVRHADGSPVPTHLGDVAQVQLPDGSFDAVTLLEVIEHVPDWRPVVRAALRLARRTVLISVPWRERIVDTVCVHCDRPTPLWGHLHSFDEHSFDEFTDVARLTTRAIPRAPQPQDGLLRYVYRRLRPLPQWLAVRLDKKEP